MNQPILSLSTPSTYLKSFLEDFVHAEYSPTSITCAQTGKYLVINQVLSTRAGIPLQAYIGLTVYDIAERMRYKHAVLANVLNVNGQISKRIIPYTRYIQAMPIHDRSIYVEEVTKKPIYSNDSKSKIIGIFGHGRNITHSINPMHLFGLYQQYYPRKEAIRCFIEHMKLGNCFYKLPTKRELEVLLTMKQSSITKEIAKKLQLSPKTVSENKGRLRDCLRNISLGELVMKLRVRHELQAAIT